MLPSRAIRSILVALLVLLGGSVGVDAAVGSAVDSAVARRSEVSDEQQFVAKINELRIGLGLEPLTVSPMLVPLARDWASHLRSQGALSHAEDLSVGVTADWSRLGENVGVGPANQLQALFDAFVASPDHYANLVKPDYRYIGVGVVYGDDGRIWTAHRFMALASGASGDPTTVSTTTTTTTPPSTPAPTTPAPSRVTPATSTSAPPSETAPGTSITSPAASTPTTSTPPRPRSIVAPALVSQIANDLAAAGL